MRLDAFVAGIDRITDERSTDMAHMDADLMGATRLQSAFEQSRSRQTRRLVEHAIGFDRFIMGNSVTACAAFRVFHHGHFLPVRVRARQTGFDCANQWTRRAPCQRQIGALHCVFGKHFRQASMSGICFGHHHDATCQLIDTVNNARAFHAANSG